MPRSGVELIERIAERWRWYAYRVRFHPWTIHELPRILGGLHEYARLMRLDRPIGIWLLLWPTLWALWISSRGKPNPRIFIIFVAGTVLMRSAGCAVNDYADRSFDPHVARTKDRPMPVPEVAVVAEPALPRAKRRQMRIWSSWVRPGPVSRTCSWKKCRKRSKMSLLLRRRPKLSHPRWRWPSLRLLRS